MVLEPEWRQLLAEHYSHLEEQKAEQFSAHNLFTQKKDIITVSKHTLLYFKDKKKIASPNIDLSYVRHEKPMIGIRISKKLIPLAVLRNSLRRKFREIFKSHFDKKQTYAVLLTITRKIQAEKKDINDILLPEWKSLLNQLL